MLSLSNVHCVPSTIAPALLLEMLCYCLNDDLSKIADHQVSCLCDSVTFCELQHALWIKLQLYLIISISVLMETIPCICFHFLCVKSVFFPNSFFAGPKDNCGNEG
mgnify:FL=1